MPHNDIIRSITSSKEEFDKLKKFDALYISYAPEEDDQAHIDAVQSINGEHDDGRFKLRGHRKGPAKIANASNDYSWYKGYVIGAYQFNIKDLEQEILLASLTHGIKFEKTQDDTLELFNQHFDSLFTVE